MATTDHHIAFRRHTNSPDNDALVDLWLTKERFTIEPDGHGGEDWVEHEPELTLPEEVIDVFVVQWLRGPVGPAGPMGAMGMTGPSGPGPDPRSAFISR